MPRQDIYKRFCCALFAFVEHDRPDFNNVFIKLNEQVVHVFTELIQLMIKWRNVY